ncbi:MAG: aminoglycoside phosphotransferase family protein [Halanaerobiaceae bacterium]
MSNSKNIEIPGYFRDKIKREFGKEGKKWLDNLPDLLKRCLEKWNIKEGEIGENLSYNLICFGISPEWGKVVIKIGVPHPDLFSEMTAISLYRGKNICRCYDKDEELGAMVLEKISPGFDLTFLDSDKDKIEIASDLITNLYIKIDKIYGLPAYGEWLDKAFTGAREMNIAGEKMYSLIDTAEEFFQELEAEDFPRVLLHGDLHHFNILKDREKDWRIIDPKGVIGIPVLEPARFMENQLHMIKEQEKLECLNYMIKIFSKKLKVSPEFTAKALLVDYVLSTCWSFEEQAPPEKLRQELQGNINDCELILDYI